jgi:asparagine synthase (glutamine-hydrolysing)
MSGIFGIIRLPGAQIAETELAAMADTLKHRGPDGIHYSARDNAGLGHCMLHSTPESLHETLPFRDETSGLTITADARIDNRDRLLADIPVRPASGQVITDSQLILRAYMKWGESCSDHLLGDFAFAIWDERAQSLFVARDHMGCKPFYYHCHDGLFVFASSAMAVARIAEVKATLNEGRVADYLVQELEGINKTCSWYNEISRMPPANCGYFRNNHFQARLYWELEPADLSHLKTDEDYLEAFTEVYSEAVRCRLRCHKEPASMLSGGLDSSTIVALARDMLVADGKPNLRTYSGISEQGEACPETESIEKIVAQGNVNSTRLGPADVDKFIGDLVVAMEPMEDPFDGGWVLLELMFLSAARDGGRVLFSGAEGESAVGAPTNYITHLLRQRQWREAWQEAQGFSRHYYRGALSASRLYLQGLRSNMVADNLRNLKYKLGSALRYRRHLDGKVISMDFSHRVDLTARLLEYDKNTRFVGLAGGISKWQQHAVQVPYLTVGIERYERLASYGGVEVRHPLLDKRLLEFSNCLPLQQKVRDGWSKFMLRSVASKTLPSFVAWREGWEELGWKFTARQALSLGADDGFPLKQMKEVLTFYVDQEKLEQCLNVGLAGDPILLADSWDHYQLYLWLQKLAKG